MNKAECSFSPSGCTRLACILCCTDAAVIAGSPQALLCSLLNPTFLPLLIDPPPLSLTQADKNHFQDGLIQFSRHLAGLGMVVLPCWSSADM